jgi:uncharacterized membrane protein YoaK (UPF0700 family)
MSSFLTELRQTVAPGRDARHGPLPPLLLAMTVVTGLVDAFSYLALGHVFVANMTGNVVFLGFAIAGAEGFSIVPSIAAIGSFALGALIGGSIGSRYADHRGRLLIAAASIQSGLVAAAVILAALSGTAVPEGYRYALIVVLAVAMGIQNAGVRKLAVPDLTTTVLTMTITGIAADSSLAGGQGSAAGRRLAGVVAMLVGALIGTALVIRVEIVWPLVLALVALVVVVATTVRLARPEAPWIHAES